MRRFLGYFSGFVLLTAADQTAKLLAVKYLPQAGSLPVIGDFLHLSYIENKGAAFSILQNQRIFFIVIAFILLAVCFYLLLTNRLKTPLGNISLMLIAAGGLGNLIDRLFKGYVVDFIYFKSINFAIFNLADSFVVVGAALMCVYVFTRHGPAGAKNLQK
jgi:signal peptidase II